MMHLGDILSTVGGAHYIGWQDYSYLGESEASCNNFYSNPCSVKNVEYLELLSISLGSPLVAHKMDIFKRYFERIYRSSSGKVCE